MEGTYQYGSGTNQDRQLPLHYALQYAPPAIARGLVSALFSPAMAAEVNRALATVDVHECFEHQWLTPLAGLIQYRACSGDGSKLALVRWFTEIMQGNLLSSPDIPGPGDRSGSECPPLQALTLCTGPCGPLEWKEHYEILAYLAGKWPELLHVPHSDGRTALVVACKKGNEVFVDLLAEFVGTLPAAEACGCRRRLADPDVDDVLADDHTTTDDDGVTWPQDSFEPTKAVPAAAHYGHFRTALQLLGVLGPCTADDCTQWDMPAACLAVLSATTEPAHLVELAGLLAKLAELGLPLSDENNSSVLHAAVKYMPVQVVQCVVQFAAVRCPALLLQANGAGFAPLAVARARMTRASDSLHRHLALPSPSATHTEALQRARDVANTIVKTVQVALSH